MKKNNTPKSSPNEVASIVAGLCSCTPAYVRMIIGGTRDYKSKKAALVLTTYKAYVKQKNQLLNEVKKLVKL